MINFLLSNRKPIRSRSTHVIASVQSLADASQWNSIYRQERTLHEPHELIFGAQCLLDRVLLHYRGGKLAPLPFSPV